MLVLLTKVNTAARTVVIAWACATAACASDSQRAEEPFQSTTAVVDGEPAAVAPVPVPARIPQPAIVQHPRSTAAGSAPSSSALTTDLWRLRGEKRQLQGAIDTYDRRLQSYDRGQAGLRPSPADQIVERRPSVDPVDRRRALERRALEDRRQDATAEINRLEYERRLGTGSRASSSSSARYLGGVRTR